MLRIGTCSWKYPSWKGLVYSRATGIDYLAEYATRYDTVEIGVPIATEQKTTIFNLVGTQGLLPGFQMTIRSISSRLSSFLVRS